MEGPERHRRRSRGLSGLPVIVAVVVVALGAGLCAQAPSNGPEQRASQTEPGAAPTVASSTTAVATTVSSTQPATTTSSTQPATTASTTSTTSTTMSDAVAECVDQLALRQKVALLVWPAVYPGKWAAGLQMVRDHQVGGVMVMKATGETPASLKAQLGALDAAAALPLVVVTDEEGGDVQRFRSLRELPSQQVVSETKTVEQARELIAEHGAVLAGLGVDMVFAPVVDVVPPSATVPLQRSRLFTGEPDRVAAFAQAYIDGWSDSGIMTVIKHFPGHGGASGDTHDVVGNTPPLDDLATRDLVPYSLLANNEVAVMVGHLTIPGLTNGVPATRSAEAIAYLRNTLGYSDHLLITDALGMGAVQLSTVDAAVASVTSGIDVALFIDATQTGAVIDALVNAVEAGRIPISQLDASARRVLRVSADELDTCPTG